MSTGLVGDKVYFPSGGINPDSNGIIIRPEEAIDSINMDITGSEVRPRFGTMFIDPFIDPVPPQPLEDVIHYHAFIAPGGGTTFFGFTNKDVYKYTSGAGWVSVITPGLIGTARFDQWSTTDFVDLEYGSTVVACGSVYTQPDEAESQGGIRKLMFFNRTTGLFEKLSINFNFPVTEEDLNATAPAAAQPSRYIVNLLFKALEYDKWVEGVSGVGYADLTVELADLGTAPPVVSVTMYSDTSVIGTVTTDIVEAKAAAIVVNMDAAVTTSAEISTALTEHILASQILTVSEGDTTTVAAVSTTELFDGTSGLVTGTLVNNTSTLATFVKITPNLFTIKTEEGSLVQCGSEIHSLPVGPLGADLDCYRLLPVDSRYVEYGDNSYVSLDGTVWQIAFTTDRYAGDDLYADYYYEKTGEYYPKVVRVFRNALMFANTYEDTVYYPWRIRYTQPGDFSITNDSWYTDLVVDDASGIRDMKTIGTAFYNTLGTYLYVYKDQAIVRGSYNPVTFIEYDTAFNEGVYANRTIQDVDGMQIFLGSNDIYGFDGVKRISLTYDAQMKGTRVREYLMSILDPIVLKNTFAVYDRFRRKYILFIKSRGQEFPTKALAYDIDRKIWMKYEFPATSAAIHVSMELSFNTIDSLIGRIMDQTGTIDELGGTSTNEVTVYAMTKSSYIAYTGMVTDKTTSVGDTAVPKTHTVITKDFLFQNLEEAERVSLMKFEAYGSSVGVRYSTEYDTLVSDFVAIPDHEVFSLTGNYKTHFYNCDTQCDKIRFSFSSTQDFKLRWMQVFSVPTTEITEE